MLSLGLASLQLMLDWGSSKIRFTPRRTIAELVVACLGIYIFIVHLFTTDNPFIPPRIFRAASPFRRLLARTTQIMHVRIVEDLANPLQIHVRRLFSDVLLRRPPASSADAGVGTSQ